jgi:hypothetical protein
LRQNARFSKPWERDWFKARNILLVCPQRQKYNLVFSENAVSTYKSAIYIENSRGITDFATRRLLYCTLVRPKLEYDSNVWSPSAVKLRSLMENVQRRATKFILNYPKEMSYTERLIATNLLPHEFRRDITNLMLLYKSKTALIPMDVNNFLCSYEPGFRSRNYNENNDYFLLKHKQQYFRNSFFVRSASLWRSLPADLKICGSLHSFKISIRKHYVSKLTSYSPPGFT